MNTIVLHTDSLAVTEYSTEFTGLSGDYEATADGLYQVGGVLDDETSIPITATFGMPLTAGMKRQRAEYLYVFGTGVRGLRASVITTDKTYTYSGYERHDRAVRFELGKGIRDNYLQFRLTSAGAEAVAIDSVDFRTIESATRRL